MGYIGKDEHSLHVHCVKHKCELVENEHYEDWFLGPDFSGFYCPGNMDNDTLKEDYEDCSELWRVSPIGRDDIDIFEVIDWVKMAKWYCADCGNKTE